MSSVPRIPMKPVYPKRCSVEGATFAVAFFAAILLAPWPTQAADTSRTVDGDLFSVEAQSGSYMRLFQRALLPGPAGAIVTDDRLMPIYQNFALRVRGVDSPVGRKNSIDFELAAWGGYTVGDLKGERALDGDLSVANVVQRLGDSYVRLGRQIYIGGASRFAQFDGVSVGVASRAGAGQVGVDLYGGSTVVPRWSSRPGYFQLGSAADTLLRYPQTIPQPNRVGTWQGGARFHGSYPKVGGAGVSFHEQHENGLLGARKLGVDAFLNPFDFATLSAQGIVDLDSQQLADGRAWFDFYPLPHLSAGLEYLRTNPALFLSKQSVLSVFAVDPFSELGTDVNYRPSKVFLIGAAGYVERFDTSGMGARIQGRTQYVFGKVTLQLALGRVADPKVGYYSSRASLRWLVARPVTVTLDQYYYFYDHRIRGLAGSAVESATAEWRLNPATRLAVSGSMTQSPYALFDTQGMLSLVVDLVAIQQRDSL